MTNWFKKEREKNWNVEDFGELHVGQVVVHKVSGTRAVILSLSTDGDVIVSVGFGQHDTFSTTWPEIRPAPIARTSLPAAVDLVAEAQHSPSTRDKSLSSNNFPAPEPAPHLTTQNKIGSAE